MVKNGKLFWRTMTCMFYVEKHDAHRWKDNSFLVSTVCVICFYIKHTGHSSSKQFSVLDHFCCANASKLSYIPSRKEYGKSEFLASHLAKSWPVDTKQTLMKWTNTVVRLDLISLTTSYWFLSAVSILCIRSLIRTSSFECPCFHKILEKLTNFLKVCKFKSNLRNVMDNQNSMVLAHVPQIEVDCNFRYFYFDAWHSYL